MTGAIKFGSHVRRIVIHIPHTGRIIEFCILQITLWTATNMRIFERIYKSESFNFKCEHVSIVNMNAIRTCSVTQTATK